MTEWYRRNFPRRYRRFDWMQFPELLTMLIGAVVVLIVIIVGVRDCRRQRDCRNLGGRVEQYNCTSDAKGNRTCDWRCVGLPAERNQGEPR